MARLTILFGIVLILLGLLSYMETGRHFPTSLIPTAFGIVLIVCGVLGRTADIKRRAVVMHVAVTVGLIGFLVTAKAIVNYIQMKQGMQFKYPVAVDEKAAMSILLLVYVALCVRSFIQARRARVAAD